MLQVFFELQYFLLQLFFELQRFLFRFFYIVFSGEVGFEDPLKDSNLCLGLVLRNSGFLQFLNGFQGIENHGAVTLPWANTCFKRRSRVGRISPSTSLPVGSERSASEAEERSGQA